MNEVFRAFVESLERSFQRLMAMDAVTISSLPREMPKSGIYLFSEEGNHLYVGRTNTIKNRLQNHCRPSSGHNSATFAFRLARKLTGITKATYTAEYSRCVLENDLVFGPVFIAQKERIRKMEVRFVAEPEPIRQALLEMYVAVSLGTPHNDFDNH